MNNNNEFYKFLELNKNKLPLYFKDFQEFKLKEKIDKSTVVEKVFHNQVLQTRMHRVEKFYKLMCRFD
ncbi:hypothetical protein ACN9MN_14745 [Chryseobacterium sp. S-02]|uniref:hypothetical protein n=1 Tax=Chryseobacterium sp. S-02 TaxID=3404064 RepID=UPI003CF36E1D